MDTGATASAAPTAAASCQPELSEDWGFRVCGVSWCSDLRGLESLSW